MLALLFTLGSQPQQSVRFLPPTPLMIESGPLSVAGGHAAPAVFDFDGDGLEDLFIGQFVRGQINVFRHVGTPSKHVYRAPSLLSAGERPVSVSAGCCIGATPQFVDLDADGRMDLVSGSYTEGVWFFRGIGAGQFAEGVQIIDEKNKPLNVGAAVAPAFTDWDADGDIDMVLGTQKGDVLLLINDGSMRFTTPQVLTSEGKPIDARHGGPALFDFNNDGVPDMLVGDIEGRLDLYLGKEKGAIDMSEGKSVLPAFPEGPRPGIRLKPTVFDWNHDGKPDILVGDFRPDASPVTRLSENVEKEIERHVMASSALAFRIFTRSGELEQAAMKEAGIADLSKATEEQSVRYQAVLARITESDKALADLKTEKAVTDERLEQIRTRAPIEGTVWILYGR